MVRRRPETDSETEGSALTEFALLGRTVGERLCVHWMPPVGTALVKSSSKAAPQTSDIDKQRICNVPGHGR